MAHYVIVEWKDSGVSVINSLWLTPMKKQAFWPPCKEQKVFNKIIKEIDPHIEDSWSMHEVKRCMYETDDFEKAVKKCMEAEDTSNLESDDVYSIRKRKVRAKKNISSSEDSEEDNEPLNKIKKKNERPPRFNHVLSKPSHTIQEASCALRISAPGASPTSGTNTSTSTIHNNNIYDLGKSVQHNITPVRTTPVRTISTVSTKTQESSCALRISAPVTFATSGTSTPTSTIHNKNTYDLDKSVQHNITPVRRTAPVRTISTASTKTEGLDHNILSLLYQIREQNDQILNHLNKKHQEVGAVPNDLPVDWPIRTIEQLNELEAYLTSRDNLSGMVSYLSSLGGKDCTSKTNIILRHLITDELATSFNFRGKRQKRPFCELSLSECIIRAVKKTENATNVQVENVMKIWLKHAPQRWTKKNNTQ